MAFIGIAPLDARAECHQLHNVGKRSRLVQLKQGVSLRESTARSKAISHVPQVSRLSVNRTIVLVVVSRSGLPSKAVGTRLHDLIRRCTMQMPMRTSERTSRSPSFSTASGAVLPGPAAALSTSFGLVSST